MEFSKSNSEEKELQHIRCSEQSVQALDANLVFTKSGGIESKNNISDNALIKSVNETQMQMQDGKVNIVKELDVGLVITESSETESEKQDTRNGSGNDTTHTVDADTRPVNDQVPFVEVQSTAEQNVLANEQHNYVQSEPIYDTDLLKRVDSNTTPESTNMFHKGGE
nr:hypothetical protein [Tanacetum cinerariifolium]